MTIDGLKKNADLIALALEIRKLIDEGFPETEVDEDLKCLLFEDEVTMTDA